MNERMIFLTAEKHTGKAKREPQKKKPTYIVSHVACLRVEVFSLRSSVLRRSGPNAKARERRYLQTLLLLSFSRLHCRPRKREKRHCCYPVPKISVYTIVRTRRKKASRYISSTPLCVDIESRPTRRRGEEKAHRRYFCASVWMDVYPDTFRDRNGCKKQIELRLSQ